MADPVFPIWGDANPKGGLSPIFPKSSMKMEKTDPKVGCQSIILANFPEKLHEKWTEKGCASLAPLLIRHICLSALADPRGRQGRPRGSDFFIFMQFSAKSL